MDRKEFEQLVNERFKDIIRLEENGIKTRLTQYKLENDQTMAIISSALHRMTSFRQAGLYAKQHARYVGHDFEKNNFPPPGRSISINSMGFKIQRP